MTRRQPLPRLWLMTDERAGDGLDRALRRLPAGSGIVFRHHATATTTRRTLFESVRRVARRRRLLLVLAGHPRDARRWGAAGAHGAQGGPTPHLLRTVSAHNRRELIRAINRRTDLIFLSPVFPTRSHPGARTLGRFRFRAIAQASPVPVIALGGMDARRAQGLGAYGWAGIDAWSGDQKRKVVPK